MGLVKGKVAIVTGAASGIGRAAAITPAREGAKVMATDLDEPGLKETQAMISKAGGTAAASKQDVTDEARWDAIFAETTSLFGSPNVLVNNAGIAIAGALMDYSLADWQRQMAVNTDSVFLGTRAAMRAMKAGGGSIINLSSVAGLRGSPAWRPIAPRRGRCGCSRKRRRSNAGRLG